MTLFEDLKPGDIFIFAFAAVSSSSNPEVRSPENAITVLVKLDRSVYDLPGQGPAQREEKKHDHRPRNAVALHCGQPTFIEDGEAVIRLR